MIVEDASLTRRTMLAQALEGSCILRSLLIPFLAVYLIALHRRRTQAIVVKKTEVKSFTFHLLIALYNQ